MKRGPDNNLTDERPSKRSRTDSYSFESDDEFSDGPESQVVLSASDQCAPIAIWAKAQTDTIGIEEIGYNALTTPIEIEYYLQRISKNRNYTKLLELLNELKKTISSDLLKRHENTDDLLAMYYRAVYLLDNIPHSLENAFLPFAVEYFTVDESDSDNDNFEEPYKFISPDLLRQVDAGDFADNKIELAPEEPAEENIISALPVELPSSKKRLIDSSYQFSYGPELTEDELKAALPGTVRIYYKNGLNYQFKHSSGIHFSKSILIELANKHDFKYASYSYMSSEIFDKLLKPEEKIAAEQYVKSELQAIEQYAPIAIWAGIKAVVNAESAVLIEHEYYLQLISENRDHIKLLELLNELKNSISSDFSYKHENTDDLTAMYYRANYLLDNIPHSLEDAFSPFSLDYLTLKECSWKNSAQPYKFKFPELLKFIDTGGYTANKAPELPADPMQEIPSEENIITGLPLEMLSHILSFLTILNIEHTALVNKFFMKATEVQSIWRKKALDYGMPLEKVKEKTELSLKHRLKNYLIELSKKFPPPLIEAIGLSKFFEYPKLRNLSSTNITPEMMQGNEIMWGIVPARTDRFITYLECPVVALCLKSKFSDEVSTVTLDCGSTRIGIGGHFDFLPHDLGNCANALTWDFVGRLSRHEPCGLPRYVNYYNVGEGNRTLPDGRPVFELTDQKTTTLTRRTSQ